MRAIHNLRNPRTRKLGPLTSSELSSVSKQLIMAVQYSIYKDEIAFLNKSRSHCATLVKQLRLFTDDSKLLCCGGRIHNMPATDATKFPHLLPPNHQVTKLIVLDVHKRLHHGGVGITVTALRQIPTIRQYVRRLLRHCVTCRKLMGKPYVAPESPPLPKVRVTEAPPFTITGVDFTGALYVTRVSNRANCPPGSRISLGSQDFIGISRSQCDFKISMGFQDLDGILRSQWDFKISMGFQDLDGISKSAAGHDDQ